MDLLLFEVADNNKHKYPLLFYRNGQVTNQCKTQSPQLTYKPNLNTKKESQFLNGNPSLDKINHKPISNNIRQQYYSPSYLMTPYQEKKTKTKNTSNSFNNTQLRQNRNISSNDQMQSVFQIGDILNKDGQIIVFMKPKRQFQQNYRNIHQPHEVVNQDGTKIIVMQPEHKYFKMTNDEQLRLEVVYADRDGQEVILLKPKQGFEEDFMEELDEEEIKLSNGNKLLIMRPRSQEQHVKDLIQSQMFYQSEKEQNRFQRDSMDVLENSLYHQNGEQQRLQKSMDIKQKYNMSYLTLPQLQNSMNDQMGPYQSNFSSQLDDELLNIKYRQSYMQLFKEDTQQLQMEDFLRGSGNQSQQIIERIDPLESRLKEDNQNTYVQKQKKQTEGSDIKKFQSYRQNIGEMERIDLLSQDRQSTDSKSNLNEIFINFNSTKVKQKDNNDSQKGQDVVTRVFDPQNQKEQKQQELIGFDLKQIDEIQQSFNFQQNITTDNKNMDIEKILNNKNKRDEEYNKEDQEQEIGQDQNNSNQKAIQQKINEEMRIQENNQKENENNQMDLIEIQKNQIIETYLREEIANNKIQMMQQAIEQLNKVNEKAYQQKIKYELEMGEIKQKEIDQQKEDLMEIQKKQIIETQLREEMANNKIQMMQQAIEQLNKDNEKAFQQKIKYELEMEEVKQKEIEKQQRDLIEFQKNELIKTKQREEIANKKIQMMQQAIEQLNKDNEKALQKKIKEDQEIIENKNIEIEKQKKDLMEIQQKELIKAQQREEIGNNKILMMQQAIEQMNKDNEKVFQQKQKYEQEMEENKQREIQKEKKYLNEQILNQQKIKEQMEIEENKQKKIEQKIKDQIEIQKNEQIEILKRELIERQKKQEIDMMLQKENLKLAQAAEKLKAKEFRLRTTCINKIFRIMQTQQCQVQFLVFEKIQNLIVNLKEQETQKEFEHQQNLKQMAEIETSQLLKQKKFQIKLNSVIMVFKNIEKKNIQLKLAALQNIQIFVEKTQNCLKIIQEIQFAQQGVKNYFKTQFFFCLQQQQSRVQKNNQQKKTLHLQTNSYQLENQQENQKKINEIKIQHIIQTYSVEESSSQDLEEQKDQFNFQSDKLVQHVQQQTIQINPHQQGEKTKFEEYLTQYAQPLNQNYSIIRQSESQSDRDKQNQNYQEETIKQKSIQGKSLSPTLKYFQDQSQNQFFKNQLYSSQLENLSNLSPPNRNSNQSANSPHLRRLSEIRDLAQAKISSQSPSISSQKQLEKRFNEFNKGLMKKSQNKRLESLQKIEGFFQVTVARKIKIQLSNAMSSIKIMGNFSKAFDKLNIVLQKNVLIGKSSAFLTLFLNKRDKQYATQDFTDKITTRRPSNRSEVSESDKQLLKSLESQDFKQLDKQYSSQGTKPNERFAPVLSQLYSPDEQQVLNNQQKSPKKNNIDIMIAKSRKNSYSKNYLQVPKNIRNELRPALKILSTKRLESQVSRQDILQETPVQVPLSNTDFEESERADPKELLESPKLTFFISDKNSYEQANESPMKQMNDNIKLTASKTSTFNVSPALTTKLNSYEISKKNSPLTYESIRTRSEKTFNKQISINSPNSQITSPVKLNTQQSQQKVKESNQFYQQSPSIKSALSGRLSKQSSVSSQYEESPKSKKSALGKKPTKEELAKQQKEKIAANFRNMQGATLGSRQYIPAKK